MSRAGLAAGFGWNLHLRFALRTLASHGLEQVLLRVERRDKFSLDKTTITDEGLLRLAEMPYLYRLRVGKTGVTEEGVAEFRRRKPGCAVAWDRKHNGQTEN